MSGLPLLKTPVSDMLNETIAATGENVTLGRFVRIDVDGAGLVGAYVHANGKIASMVEVKCDSDAVAASEGVRECAKNVAMQIAAANPLALDASCLDPALMEREREVYRQKAREEGKPENIIDKIAEGAVKKYCKEVCLLEQPISAMTSRASPICSRLPARPPGGAGQPRQVLPHSAWRGISFRQETSVYCRKPRLPPGRRGFPRRFHRQRCFQTA